MKKTVFYSLFLFYVASLIGQNEYSVSPEFPFGKPNPEAPEQIQDYAPMMGLCDCKSITRKQDGSWNEEEDMTWEWKYIMNGTAVQDETLKSDGSNSGSIRQFIKDSSLWYVHWYSVKTPSPVFPVWKGKKDNDKIVLYKEQKAPNGTDGFFRLTFYDMSKTGYKWIGEWVDKTESIVYPTWKINCTRTEKN